MGILNFITPALLYNLTGYFGSKLGNKAMAWGDSLKQQPMVVSKEPSFDSLYAKNLDEVSTKLAGLDDGDWTRREQRRFRKRLGMSKLDFRNWKAELLGLKPNLDYSRGDIRAAERAYNFFNPTSEEIPVEQTSLALPSIFKTPDELHLEYVQLRFGLPEPWYVLLSNPPSVPQPNSPITYNFGNNMKDYWANQAQKVFGNLTQDELYKISGGDGEINYDDAIAWQNSIGAGNDGKFGSGTIKAMNSKYGLNAMTDYVNPVNKNTTVSDVTQPNWETLFPPKPYKFNQTQVPYKSQSPYSVTWGV